MKRIKFAGDARKKPFRNSNLYEKVDDAADPIKFILSQALKCILS